MRLRDVRPLALLALAAWSVSASAQTTRPSEFPFAVGAGGSFISDGGRPANVKAFSTGGYHVFGEIVLDPGVLLQVRYESFLVPGQAPPSTPLQPPSGAGSPRVRVSAGNISAGYLFRETWWQAGLFGGVGVYNLSPHTPEAGQVPADVSETVFGWHGGVLTVFQVQKRVDLRLEAAAYLLRSDSTHKPVRVGASVAYHF
jgi:hypothetical protein